MEEGLAEPLKARDLSLSLLLVPRRAGSPVSKGGGERVGRMWHLIWSDSQDLLNVRDTSRRAGCGVPTWNMINRFVGARSLPKPASNPSL